MTYHLWDVRRHPVLICDGFRLSYSNTSSSTGKHTVLVEKQWQPSGGLWEAIGCIALTELSGGALVVSAATFLGRGKYQKFSGIKSIDDGAKAIVTSYLLAH